MQYQFVRKKQIIYPAASKSDDLVDASMTGYPIHIDQDFPKCLGEDHISYAKPFEGRTSCVMLFFRDIFHSTKSTDFSQINCFFIIAKCIAAGWNGFAGRIGHASRCVKSPDID